MGTEGWICRGGPAQHGAGQHPGRIHGLHASLPRGVVAILFTDLVDSTRLLERLGDSRFEALRRLHFRMSRAAFTRHGGLEVKNLGDGFMVAFVSPTAAVRAAAGLLAALARHNVDHQDEAISIRIGIHVGEPILDRDDYFGSPVVIAKRLCDSANPDEIRGSELVASLAGLDDGIRAVSVGDVALKGFERPVAAVHLEVELPELGQLTIDGPGVSLFEI